MTQHASIFISLVLLFFQIIQCRGSLKVPGIGEKQKRSGFIEGDFIIGALFPVHEQPLLKAGGTDPLKCGEIRERFGIQRIEAAFFAIESINNDTNILPKIPLGIHIRDGCSSESVVLHQTIKLIEEPTPETKEQTRLLGLCSAKNDDDGESPLIGVIGPSTTSTTIIVQNLLKLFQIPQVGYSATSRTLTDTRLHNYLLRMVPEDEHQVIIMFKLLKKFNWTYISLAYNDDEYGRSGASIVQERASSYNVCISRTAELAKSYDEEKYDESLQQLSIDNKAKVVICFCSSNVIKNLLKSIKRNGLTGRFLIIGSDAWPSRNSIVENYEEQAVGSLTLEIKSTPIQEFNDYYFGKNLTNNHRNPWFREFWEYRFDCTLGPTSNTNLTRCTGEENLSEDDEQDTKIPYIIKSIYAMAHGLDKMIADVCKNYTLCDDLYPFNSSNYMEYLKKTNFLYEDEPVNFTRINGPWRISYNIYNFQKLEDDTYKYVKIGEYDGNYDELQDSEYDEDFFDYLKLYGDLQFSGGSTEIKSVCSDPCLPGQIKLISSIEQKCCWKCIQCPTGEYQLNETGCTKCPSGEWPNDTQTGCVKVDLTYTQWLDIQSIVSLIISFIGITLTIATAIIFVKYRETPVVKSSTRELCYMMLIGMVCAHCISFAVITKPTLISCTIARTVPPITFATIYAALLVKTNRIARILAISKKKFPNLNPRFMSLKAQIIITSILIAIQTVICLAMLIKERSSPEIIHIEEGNQLFIYLVCPLSGQAILIPFSFVAFLIIMCTLYAVKTRNLPHNFNEAKFIGFSMYVTCITWVAFGLVYYGSDLQVITTCICASTNALVILIFLFFPKLYIILCAPEKNTRANFTTSKGIRCIIGKEDSSQIGNKGNLMETNFKYIPDFNSHERKSISEHSETNSRGRKSTAISSISSKI
ncbi:metabotropic glutamate receptor 1-like [Planococcus citri]|uniref:metabotropic glutamate receptor 1-like n=1 Tax=Planococcus citri TaxID=170843 RepID=UPI0031F948D2